MNHHGIFYLFLLVLFAAGCEKEEAADTPPEISDAQILLPSNVNDLNQPAVLSFSYVDENGDLGTNDTTSSCFLFYHEINGNDTLDFQEFSSGYALPYLTPNASNPYIEGSIQLNLEAPYFNIASDSAWAYSIEIMDRAGNKSNRIYTPFQEK